MSKRIFIDLASGSSSEDESTVSWHEPDEDVMDVDEEWIELEVPPPRPVKRSRVDDVIDLVEPPLPADPDDTLLHWLTALLQNAEHAHHLARVMPVLVSLMRKRLVTMTVAERDAVLREGGGGGGRLLPELDITRVVLDVGAKRIASVLPFRNAEKKVVFDTAVLETLGVDDLPPASQLALNIMVHNDLRIHEQYYLLHELLAAAVAQHQEEVISRILAMVPDTMVVDAILSYGVDALQSTRDTQNGDMADGHLIEMTGTAANLSGIRPNIHTYLRQEEPQNMQEILYPFQQTVVQWALERAIQLPQRKVRMRGGVLALKAGMGKTRVMLAVTNYLLNHVFAAGEVVVVLMPIAVLRDWLGENHELFHLRMQLLHESDVRLGEEEEEEEEELEPNPGQVVFRGESKPNEARLDMWFNRDHVQVILSVIPTFRARFQPGTALYAALKPRLRMLVIDEIHEMSNSTRTDYQALMELLEDTAPIRFGLTGTPFRNRTDDLANQIAFLNPGWYAELAGEREPAEVGEDPVLLDQYINLDYEPNTVELTVLEERTFNLPLNPLDREIYDYVTTASVNGRSSITRRRLLAISGDFIDPNKLREIHEEYMERHAEKAAKVRLAADIKLAKQLNKEIDKEEKLANRGKTSMKLVRSIDVLVRDIQPKQAPLKDPRMFPAKTTREVHTPLYQSTKMAYLMVLLREIILDPDRSEEKVLVFSSFRRALQRAQQLLWSDYELSMATDSVQYTGQVPPNQRDILRRRFKEEPHLRIMFLTPGAGGTGLNLQQANHIILLDPIGFTDAIRQQVRARAHRVGQQRPVIQYLLLSEDTYEDIRMQEIQAAKKKLFEETMEQQHDPNALPREEERLGRLRGRFGRMSLV
jgi:superfamily II DNA or RNA helicase